MQESLQAAEPRRGGSLQRSLGAATVKRRLAALLANPPPFVTHRFHIGDVWRRTAFVIRPVTNEQTYWSIFLSRRLQRLLYRNLFVDDARCN